MFRALLAAMTALFIAPNALAADPIRFAVTDIEGLEVLTQEFGAFEEALEGVTGLEVELFPVSSRTAAVEAMNAEQVDFVLTGPAEYVVIKELTDPTIVVAWQRPDYFAQIVVLADGPISDAEDLKGKTVTFGSVGSTSQHLGPAQALADLGLNYNEDYTAQIINRNVAVEALIRGDVAGVGMNFGHLTKIREGVPGHRLHRRRARPRPAERHPGGAQGHRWRRARARQERLPRAGRGHDGSRAEGRGQPESMPAASSSPASTTPTTTMCARMYRTIGVARVLGLCRRLSPLSISAS